MLPQTSAEMRRPMYEDLTEVLTFGFLSIPLQIGPIPISLRTLTEGDLFLLRHRSKHVEEMDFRRWLLATSTWMVQGQVLLDSPNAAAICFKGYRNLRPGHLQCLMSVVRGLAAKQSALYDVLEAFCCEQLSRGMWRQTNGQYPSTAYSGLPNLQIGMNALQRIWVAHNTAEDIRERTEAEWNHAKMVASAMSPKGVEQLNQREATLRQTDRERKQDLLDRTYYKWIGYLKEDGRTVDSELPVFRQASTADELAEEMRKWVTGEMDFHDKIVAEHKKSLLEAYEREMAARQEQVEQVRRELEENGEDPSALRLVGYTLDQIRERLPTTVRKTVYDDSKGADYLTNKYLTSEQSAGFVQVHGGKVVEVKDSPVPLSEEVAGRAVKYGVKG